MGASWRSFIQIFVSAAAATATLAPVCVRGEGLILQGVGPVNRSMAGAATAAPIDAAGAIFRNPATMSGLAGNQVTFGAELLLQTETISSTIPTMGGPLSGTTDGEPGANVIPCVAMVNHSQHSPWTWGVGIYGVAGFKSNYPASTTNPVLMPQPNGLGRVFAELEVYEVAPALSYAVTDQFSVGVSPALSIGRLNADPLILSAPDNANGDAAFTYPSGQGTRYHYGGGVQVGAYYIANDAWRFGAAVKSPTWMEDFRFFTTNELGLPRLEKADFDLPMTVSLGTAFTGIDRILWAFDVRYFDYKNTNGFRSTGFNPDGSVRGLGWSNIFSAATAIQYTWTDSTALRVGYTFQQNPIPDSNTFFNAASPLILNHVVSFGITQQLSRRVALNVAYLHGFEETQTGPVVLPGVGPVPGSSVTSEISADALGAGFTVNY